MIDRDSTSGPGVDAVHVWAYPINGGSPVFLGTATLGGARGDVGAAYGSQFTNSGYNVTVSGLPPGQYQSPSTRTRRSPARSTSRAS